MQVLNECRNDNADCSIFPTLESMLPILMQRWNSVDYKYWPKETRRYHSNLVPRLVNCLAMLYQSCLLRPFLRGIYLLFASCYCAMMVRLMSYLVVVIFINM